MAASALFILDLKGSIILYRDYRGDVPIKFAERFISKLNELEEAGKVFIYSIQWTHIQALERPITTSDVFCTVEHHQASELGSMQPDEQHPWDVCTLPLHFLPSTLIGCWRSMP